MIRLRAVGRRALEPRVLKELGRPAQRGAAIGPGPGDEAARLAALHTVLEQVQQAAKRGEVLPAFALRKR